MKLRSTVVALALLVTAACISTGGGGPKPPTPPPTPVQAMDIGTSDSVTGRSLGGVNVTCNTGEPQGRRLTGTTNDDGYLLLAEVESGKRLDCLLTRGDYKEAQAEFTPTPDALHMLVALAPLSGPEPPAPPAQTFKPLRLSESRRWFRTDDGLFDWREVSAFSLQSRMLRGEDAQVRALLQEYKRLGFTLTRVMLTLGGDYWEGRAGSPLNYSLRSCPDGADYWTKLDALLDMHAQEGLRTRLVVYGALECFGGVWDPTGRRDIYQGEVRRKGEAFTLELVRRLRDGNRTGVQLELANEPNQIGMRDSSRALRDLGRQVKREWPTVLLNLGDVNGMEFADVFDAAFDAADRHVDRNPGLRFIEADKRMGEDAYRDDQPRPMPAISGEPKNMGELRLDGRNADVATYPISAYSYAVVTRSRQILPNFHYDGGLWTTPIKPETLASMRAFHQALNAFPMVDANRFRGHWAESQGNWWKRDPYPGSDDIREIENHIRAGRGPWRVYGLGDWAAVFPYRPGANVLGWANRPATVVDRYADDLYEVAIVRKN